MDYTLFYNLMTKQNGSSGIRDCKYIMFPIYLPENKEYQLLIIDQTENILKRYLFLDSGIPSSANMNILIDAGLNEEQEKEYIKLNTIIDKILFLFTHNYYDKDMYEQPQIEWTIKS